MNVSRQNVDHNHEALNTLMDTDAADGILLPTSVGVDLDPDGDGTRDLGDGGAQWNNVYGVAFYGDGSNLTGVGAAAASALTDSGKCAENIAKGQAVYISGASGSQAEYSLCDNTIEAKAHFLGIAAETKTTGQTILIRVEGELTSVDASGGGEAWADGQMLYMSTGGDLTDTPPTGGAIIGLVHVKNNHAVTGKFHVGWELETHELSAPAATDIHFHMGDDVGVQNLSFLNYSGAEVGFINSLGDADLNALIEPKVLYPDATEAAEDAHALIIVDLDDPDTVWDLQSFMQQARNTSWWWELGPPPIHGAMWINAAQDELKWWNRETGVEYMVFETDTDDMLPVAVLNSLKFLDGKIYVSQENLGQSILDLLRDHNKRYKTQGLISYNGNMSERNDGLGSILRHSSPALPKADVQDIDAIRDHFGRKDEFGRPLHWWAAAMDDGANGQVSIYNARDDAIYDSGTNSMFQSVSISPLTGRVYAGEHSTNESVVDYGPIWTIDADAFTQNNIAWNVTSAPEILDGDPNTLAVLPGRSAARPGADLLLIGTVNVEPGISMIHTDPVEPAKGGTVLITADYNSPYMKANAGAAYAFEGNATGLTHNANTLTASGAGVTYPAGVIGLCARFDEVDYLSAVGLTGLDVAAGADITVAIWYKTNTDTPPGGGLFEFIYECSDGAGTGNLQLTFADSGILSAAINDDGNVTDTLSTVGDVYDALWHHVVFIRRDGSIYLYFDGVLVDSDTATAAAVSMDRLNIGNNQPTGWEYDGSVDDFVISVDAAWTEDEVRWVYQRGLRAQVSNRTADDGILTANMAALQTDQRSGYIGVASGITWAMIFDEFGIPWGSDSIASNVNDVPVRLVPGTDEPTYIMGGASDIEFVQRDVRISDLAASLAVNAWAVPDRGGYDAIVDLLGLGDFYLIQDAVDYCDEGDSIYVGPGQHDNPVDVNKANMVVRGSGRGTLVTNGLDTGEHAIVVTAVRVSIGHLAFQTEAGGGGGGKDAINLGAAWGHIADCWVPQSDDAGISLGASQWLIAHITIESADSHGIVIGGAGDDSIITGCIIDDAGGDPINIFADGENCVVVANRTDGAIVDASGTSVVASNDETGF